MQQFKIRKDGFREIKKLMLIRMVPLLIIVVTVGIVMSTVNSKNKASEVNVLPVIIPVMAAAVGFGLYRAVNRQRQLFESYTLTLTNNLITRVQLNTPTISIYFNDIKEIIKSKNGSFTIKGKDAYDMIFIPPQIENYTQLEEALTQVRAITIKSKDNFLQKHSVMLSVLTIGLMVSVYTVTNKIIVGLGGTLLIGLMLWSFFEIQRSKNIDSKTRRGSWFVLLILISVITVMIVKLIA